MNAKQLKELSDQTFGKRVGLVSLWQEQAENFYPERAGFTVRRYLGDDFAGNLSSSFPVICRRELASSFSTMLRPAQKPWFEMVLPNDDTPDIETREWLEWKTVVQRRAMYDIKSLFSRAAVEGDHDFAAFGQSVLSVRLNKVGDALLYRCWHLRDVAWLDDEEGNVCPIFRKWKPYAKTLVEKFRDKNHPSLLQLARTKPYEEVECLHMIVAADAYEKKTAMPYWSIYYDCQHETLLEAVPTWNKEYAISRWQTVSDSQYAYSPATVAALPDARLLQSMTYTLLEAGEKSANPPLIATQGAVRSDVTLLPGGMNWIDFEYDERKGEALRPLNIDTSGMGHGFELARDTREMLRVCFFLDKIKPFLPTEDKEMTAFQAGQIVAQYIRDALPIFEPMESEVNGQLCELTADLLLRHGAFGSPLDVPKALRGRSFTFRFQSPLHDAIESQKGQKFLEMSQLIASAVALDQGAANVPDTITALRDALSGIQVPAKWQRTESQVKELQAEQADQMQTRQLLETLGQGADVAKTAGEAAQLGA